MVVTLRSDRLSRRADRICVALGSDLQRGLAEIRTVKAHRGRKAATAWRAITSFGRQVPSVKPLVILAFARLGGTSRCPHGISIDHRCQ